VYTASHDGVVSAFNPVDGKRIWEVELDINLTAGPGLGDDMLVVGGGDGHVVALDTSDGGERWRVEVLGETLATPLVTDEGVVVYTIDGRLRVLSLFDGTERWGIQQDAPRLTLRGSAEPVVVGNSLMVGFDNGRLVSINLATGDTEWESMISPPSGRSDLERLSDVDGRLQAIGQDLYASGYNGRVMSLAAESGQLLWAREFSTYTGVSVDWNNVYFVTDEGELVALSRQNGSDVWRSDALLRREPTVPVPFDLTVVAGDFEGYLHFFSNLDGRPVARVRVGRGPLSGLPVVIGDQLYVQTESGELAVYRVQKPKREAPPASDSSESR
jgi:outer membrane protein assembly factor BamB